MYDCYPEDRSSSVLRKVDIYENTRRHAPEYRNRNLVVTYIDNIQVLPLNLGFLEGKKSLLRNLGSDLKTESDNQAITSSAMFAVVHKPPYRRKGLITVACARQQISVLTSAEVKRGSHIRPTAIISPICNFNTPQTSSRM